jgi:DNA-binding NarL/FixJ family response regulator
MMTARVLIAHDDAAVRDELDELLSGCGFEVESRSSLREVEEAFERIDPPAAAVLDVRLGASSLLDWMASAKSASRVPIVLLSAEAELDDALRALALGASDFVDASESRERLVLAIEGAASRARGRRLTSSSAYPLEEGSPLAERDLLGGLRDGRLVCAAEIHHGGERHVLFAERPDPRPLPPRQRYVLEHIAQPIKAIASELGVSEATVWAEIGLIQRALGFRDRYELLRIVAPLVARSRERR